MNSPSPLIPQGSTLEQQNQVRSSLKIKIFCAIGVNVAVLLGLLLTPGCKREQPPVETVQPEPAPVYDQTNPPPAQADAEQPGAAPAGSNAPQAVVESPAIPAQPAIPSATASEYKIQAGDSFYTIGKKFNVSPKAIQAANPTIDPKKLQIGKSIVIPAPTAPSAPVAGAGPVVDVASGETTYTVKSGDTLGKLAAQFHTTVAAIQSANGLKDTRIKVGDKLKMPAKSTTP